jgi:hypothetical protein
VHNVKLYALTLNDPFVAINVSNAAGVYDTYGFVVIHVSTIEPSPLSSSFNSNPYSHAYVDEFQHILASGSDTENAAFGCVTGGIGNK